MIDTTHRCKVNLDQKSRVVQHGDDQEMMSIPDATISERPMSKRRPQAAPRNKASLQPKGAPLLAIVPPSS